MVLRTYIKLVCREHSSMPISSNEISEMTVINTQRLKGYKKNENTLEPWNPNKTSKRINYISLKYVTVRQI